jgi:hypothetical protein
MGMGRLGWTLMVKISEKLGRPSKPSNFLPRPVFANFGEKKGIKKGKVSKFK